MMLRFTPRMRCGRKELKSRGDAEEKGLVASGGPRSSESCCLCGSPCSARHHRRCVLRRHSLPLRSAYSRTFLAENPAGEHCFAMADWGYEEHNGPVVWPVKYPDAGGCCQSPVDIITSEAQESSDLTQRPLTINYGSQICKSIVNTGRGWRVDVGGDDSILSGGPLEHDYQLAQFHCHWGRSSGCGSEHTVDGESYPAELHFVHWNKELYKSCSAAVASPKGLAVLGVFLKLGEENPEVEKLSQAVESIRFKDQSTELPIDFDPSLMFPADQSYWTYDGSLTTPPCYETVTWIVFKHPIEITEKQLECFRELRCYCEDENCPIGQFQGKCIENFRPTQPLNERSVLDCAYR